MKVAITGASGFLGWHVACRVAATRGYEVLRLGRRDFDDVDRLKSRLRDVDVVIHAAGVNRAESPDEVEHGNIKLAGVLASSLQQRPVHIVYANSIQVELSNPYGRGKRRASEILKALPGSLADVLLPNLFGEHGRPGYNSFVATFSHAVANGKLPSIQADNEVPLLHVQAAAEALIAAAEARTSMTLRPPGELHRVSEVLQTLAAFHASYAMRGELPDLSTTFARDLFNTYRANLFPNHYPLYAEVHSDARGDLVESMRSRGGASQAFVSTTVPGATRGNHYHLHKVERFMVIKGEAEIALRRLYHRDVVRFRVSGERPGLIDMPTLWTHNLRNISGSELVTVFWADQLLDQDNPDQYPLDVELAS